MRLSCERNQIPIINFVQERVNAIAAFQTSILIVGLLVNFKEKPANKEIRDAFRIAKRRTLKNKSY